MRQLASFLLFAFALPALAADVWRWKDDQGVVHFSETPVPGAERVVTPALPTGGAPPPAQPPTARQAEVAPAYVFRYSECAVTAPGNDQVFNSVNSVTAALSIVPSPLQEHHIRVILDGVVYAAWPSHMLTFSLKEVYRGTHTLNVEVLDANNKPLCTGKAITFHVQQPSLLAPNRKPRKP